jgi:hypothetical protein
MLPTKSAGFSFLNSFILCDSWILNFHSASETSKYTANGNPFVVQQKSWRIDFAGPNLPLHLGFVG